MPGPQNAILGEEYGTELPETKMEQVDLATERNAAKFSRSREYKLLKEHLERRIEFYRTYLPDGTAVTNLTPQDLVQIGQKWVVANTIIAEFRAVLDAYENAQEAVKEHDARGN